MPITANYIYNLHICPLQIMCLVYVGTWVVFFISIVSFFKWHTNMRVVDKKLIQINIDRSTGLIQKSNCNQWYDSWI